MKGRIRSIFSRFDKSPEALVIANSADSHLDQSFFYVFDAASGLFEGAIAVAHPDGKLDLITSPLEEESARQAAKHDPDVDIHVPMNPTERDDLVRKLVPGTGIIAMHYREVTHEAYRSVEKLLPGATFVDASEPIRRARMVKDENEIERLDRAAAIASRVAKEIPSLLQSGMTELELAAEMEYHMMRGGASGRSFATIIAFGANGAEPHYSPKNVKLSSGQSLVCDFGAFFRRYASDITRSFRYGSADAELKRVHETVLEAQNAALEIIKAGVMAREAHMAAQRVIDASPWKGRFTHGLGHSIGLAVHDGFAMYARSEEPLLAGMTVTVEPGIYLPGKGGVRIEDDILVTDQGYRFLTQAPREYLEIAA
jgi:Xaa-Pro aminopeptidase